MNGTFNLVILVAIIFCRYVAFDFHRECKNMQYHKLNNLIDQITADQDQFSYFLISDKRLVHLQEGVFRTNCIDCLDRTNVVQSMIAWRSLSKVLQVRHPCNYLYVRISSLKISKFFTLASFVHMFEGGWSNRWEEGNKGRNKFLSIVPKCVGWSCWLYFDAVFRDRSSENGLHENRQKKSLGNDTGRM
jgi:hypothetical protein